VCVCTVHVWVSVREEDPENRRKEGRRYTCSSQCSWCLAVVWSHRRPNPGHSIVGPVQELGYLKGLVLGMLYASSGSDMVSCPKTPCLLQPRAAHLVLGMQKCTIAAVRITVISTNMDCLAVVGWPNPANPQGRVSRPRCTGGVFRARVVCVVRTRARV
jgi:hypothetical protein